ncbi:hypothetical protein [Haloactinomyces albus]|uniref:Uncharacterized protein n=1 Tax=Haloactinomyces albus TaxID=1352928 RepID=A0AAE3ZI64_9ACTN|nr:hypothetical protein [Haloactinomyces albus]MDR7304605.1 hypothetical protein [Haloactinomyces albus]
MTTTSPTVSEETWEAFIASYESEHQAMANLLRDPESFAALTSTDSASSPPEPFGGLSNVDDDLEHAMNKLHEATAKPLPHPEHPATQLAKQCGQKIHDVVVNADKQVNAEIGKLKDAKSLDTAAWNAMVDDREKKDGEALLKANHEFWEGIRDRGNKNPRERGFLLTIADAYSAAAKAIINFLKKAALWLIQKLEWVWDKIKEAAGWVWDKIKIAAKAVAHFFGL